MSKIVQASSEAPLIARSGWSKLNSTSLALFFFIILTALFFRPVIFHFFTQVSGVGDTYEYVWRLWWFKHTLIDTGVSPWLAPFIFYPIGYAVAYSELTPTNTIVGLPFTLALGEYSAHNALLLLNFCLTGFTTFLLARHLTGNSWAALLAGIIFAFTPYRRGQYFHLIHLTTQWLPLIFLFLDKFLQTGRPKYAFAGGLAFGLNALASWYFALAGALLSLVWLVVRAWPWPVYLKQRSIWLGLVIFAATATGLIAPFLPPFLAVSSDVNTRPTLENTNFWAASPTDYLLPSPFHPLWGSFIEEKILPLTSLSDQESPTQADFEAGRVFPNSNLNITTEFVLAPGFVALLFVVYSLRWAAAKLTKPWLYLTLVAIVLSLGLTLHVVGRQLIIPTPPVITTLFNQSINYISLNLSQQHEPFTLAQETGMSVPLPALLVRWFVPAVGNTRTWTRFGQFAIFGLAILAAYGAAAWYNREIARPSKSYRRSTTRAYTPWLIVIALALFELWWKPMPTFPPARQRPVDVWLRQQPSYHAAIQPPWPGNYCDNLNSRRQPDGDAIIQYPLESSFNGVQFIYSRVHCKPMVHAYGNPFGFMLGRRYPELLIFPQPASLTFLSRWGVRYVLIETVGPGTADAQKLLEQVAAVPCLQLATVQGSVHVFEMVDCGHKM
jgi:hypothetical protein